MPDNSPAFQRWVLTSRPNGSQLHQSARRAGSGDILFHVHRVFPANGRPKQLG